MAQRESDIDYRNNYFKYPELTPIHVRSNTQSVDCTAGGGANGHLGLICDITTYTSIPGTALYVCPANPGPLILPIGATQYQIVQAQDQHEEDLHLFRE
eukprot:11760234-Ditylum_brightwellii.AAC.1